MIKPSCIFNAERSNMNVLVPFNLNNPFYMKGARLVLTFLILKLESKFSTYTTFSRLDGADFIISILKGGKLNYYAHLFHFCFLKKSFCTKTTIPS